MRFVVALIIATLTGCISLDPGMHTQARVRGYNGRNAGEIQGSQSLTIQIQLPENPEAAAAVARNLGPISQSMGNTAPIAQHFEGGGVQTDAGGSGGWLSGLFRKSEPAPVAVPQVPVAPAQKEAGE